MDKHRSRYSLMLARAAKSAKARLRWPARWASMTIRATAVPAVPALPILYSQNPALARANSDRRTRSGNRHYGRSGDGAAPGGSERVPTKNSRNKATFVNESARANVLQSDRIQHSSGGFKQTRTKLTLRSGLRLVAG